MQKQGKKSSKEKEVKTIRLSIIYKVRAYFPWWNCRSLICFTKQSGHTWIGIVSDEPSSNSIFITSSSVKVALHFMHLLFFINSSRLRSFEDLSQEKAYKLCCARTRIADLIGCIHLQITHFCFLTKPRNFFSTLRQDLQTCLPQFEHST